MKAWAEAAELLPCAQAGLLSSVFYFVRWPQPGLTRFCMSGASRAMLSSRTASQAFSAHWAPTLLACSPSNEFKRGRIPGSVNCCFYQPIEGAQYSSICWEPPLKDIWSARAALALMRERLMGWCGDGSRRSPPAHIAGLAVLSCSCAGWSPDKIIRRAGFAFFGV